MKQKKAYNFFLYITFLMVTLSSCSGYNKLLKDGTYEEKKDAALQYYGEEEYIKTLTLLEDVLPYYKNSNIYNGVGDTLYYTYCMSYYNMGDFLLAGYYFKRYARNYPNSRRLEEAYFYSALCSVRNSPNLHLDQTETLNALDELQIFIDNFPDSKRIDTCNIIMDDLRSKLEEKRFESAKLYYTTEDYKAAVVAFNATLEEFPESNHKEEILYYLVLSNFNLAINSIEDKKLDRLNNTMKSYSTFVAAFPESSRLNELNGLKSRVEKEIAIIKSK